MFTIYLCNFVNGTYTDTDYFTLMNPKRSPFSMTGREGATAVETNQKITNVRWGKGAGLPHSQLISKSSVTRSV